MSAIPSHIPGPPGESWERSEPDALHWSRPHAGAQKRASRQRSGTGLALLTGATAVPVSCVESKRPTLFTSSRPPRRPLAGCSGHVTLYGDRRASSRDAARTPARARHRLSGPLGLRRGRMRAGSARRRLRWLVSGPSMAAGERLGRSAYSDESVPRPTAQRARL